MHGPLDTHGPAAHAHGGEWAQNLMGGSLFYCKICSAATQVAIVTAK